eukprot:3336767-Amphidinium_carterae.1
MATVWLCNPAELELTAAQLKLTGAQYIEAIKSDLWVQDKSYDYGSGQGPTAILRDAHYSIQAAAAISKWSSRSMRRAILRATESDAVPHEQATGTRKDLPGQANRGGMRPTPLDRHRQEHDERVEMRAFVSVILMETPQAFVQATQE